MKELLKISLQVWAENNYKHSLLYLSQTKYTPRPRDCLCFEYTLQCYYLLQLPLIQLFPAVQAGGKGQ
jgi:hypothetical protein